MQRSMAVMRIEVAATVAAKDAKMEAERKKKDAEMDAMRNQMAEMALSNRLYELNKTIPLNWLNDSIGKYKVKCKRIIDSKAIIHIS